MEGKSIQKPKLVQIPICKYKKDIEAGSAKEKKNDILDLFSNSNNLCSEEEFKEIKYKLHNACSEGDLDLIKIYLSETIENESKDFTFKIDRKNQTASLFKVNCDIEEVIVPRTVKYESTDYLITSISGTSENVSIIKFVKDSKVKTIYRFAFPYDSNIEEIYFPDSLKELKEGWCYNANKLKKIKISQSNDRFIMKEDKYLLGKSDQNKDEFDVLLFAS
ncbi:hypothetical protein M9Y10_018671 [Tritrichomonas musculus]|uniref:Uncharacterized protein n=1 Tax=Tritrichomonas musculus TaxID=1915356 RepID=A0ABR2GM23_9EUKA